MQFCLAVCCGGYHDRVRARPPARWLGRICCRPMMMIRSATASGAGGCGASHGHGARARHCKVTQAAGPCGSLSDSRRSRRLPAVTQSGRDCDSVRPVTGPPLVARATAGAAAARHAQVASRSPDGPVSLGPPFPVCPATGPLRLANDGTASGPMPRACGLRLQVGLGNSESEPRLVDSETSGGGPPAARARAMQLTDSETPPASKASSA